MAGKVSQKKAQRTLTYAQELYDDAESAWATRRSYRTIENMAMFRGYQYTLRDKPMRGRVDYNDQKDEGSEVVNICRPLVNAAVSTLLPQLPYPKIAPMKNDPRAQSRAKMSENLAFSFTRNGVIDMFELRECATWATIVGGAWMKEFWDPNSGRLMPDTTDTGLEGNEDTDPQGYAPLADVLREGDIATEFVSTIDGLPDPAARTPREMGYFIHRKIRPVFTLMNQFNVDYAGEDTMGRWDVGTRSTEQAAMRNVIDDDQITPSVNGLTQRGFKNVLGELCEMWMLPNKEYPYGLLLIWSGGMILSVGPNPLYPARLPFHLCLGPNKTPNTLYADGIIEDIKHLQRVVNKVETKKLEIIDKMANPHLLVPNGSGIDHNTWGNIPGQVIPYNRGWAPTQLQPAEVPQSMFQHTNDQIDRAKFLVGHSDLATGQAQSEFSGRAFAFAAQNAQSAKSPDIISFRNFVSSLMQGCLYQARQRYDEGRIIRVVGPVDNLEATEFTRQDYDLENEILPEPFSDEPTTHAARLSTALELQGAGFFGEDPSSERLRRFVGGSYSRKSAFDPFQSDRDRARREHLYVLNDPMNIPGVKTYDIHRIHLEEHNEFRKSAEYEQMPPQTQAMFDQHCDLHEMADMAAKFSQNHGGELENQFGPPPPQQQQQPGAPPGPAPEPQGQPSPQDGGAGLNPGQPPSVADFNQMSESQQRSSDQQ